MKKLLLSLLTLSASFFLSGIATAQKVQQNFDVQVVEEKNTTNDFCFVRFPDSGPSIKNHIPYILKEVLHAPQGHTLRLERKETDRLGYTHYRYKQLIGGVEVEDSYIYVHEFNHRLVSVNGAFFKIADGSSRSVIAESKARESLQSNVVFEPGKFLYFRDSLDLKLAYKYVVRGINQWEPSGIVYVDAVTGNVIKRFSEQKNVSVQSTVNTRYNGQVEITSDSAANGIFTLVDSTRGNGIEVRNLNGINAYSPSADITDTSSSWTQEGYSSGALDVMYALEKTYDYFSAVYGRNSIDNAGMHLTGLVNFGTSNFSYYFGNSFVFGLGVGSTPPYTPFDIVAHEYVHGIVDYSAAFSTAYEPLAINESFCDILAVAAEQYVKGGPVDYSIGEEVNQFQIPLRSMKIPKITGLADTYNGQNYGIDVYSRATVQDFWFYLLCEGGYGVNDLLSNYKVDGIGIDKASAIAYRALTVYLGPSSGFIQSRTATIQAAIDLFGACSDEVKQVTRAWYAVGVGTDYTDGVAAQAYPSTEEACLGNSISFVNLCVNASTYSWNYGDGQTSSAPNNPHTYTTPGDYIITLIVTGSSVCNTDDTLTLSMHIQDYSNITPPSCIVTRTGAGDTRGIYEVNINDITHKSGSSFEENYMDFTCKGAFKVYENDNFIVNVLNGVQFAERVSLFIDYNNNGSFASNEQFFYYNATAPLKSLILYPSTAVLNTPLRMRVTSTNNWAQTCTNIQYGQAEDYSIIISSVDSAPTAEFTVSDTIAITNKTITFTNLTRQTQNVLWLFPGGIPASSTSYNPVVTYPIDGYYPVTLIAINAFGADTITKMNYIHAISSYNMCSTVSTVNELTGSLYDPGGPNGNFNYQSNPCDFVIEPECADSIFINFTEFQIGLGDDTYLKVFDSDKNGNSYTLFNGNGFLLPGQLVATHGKVRIRTLKKQYSLSSGFALNWTTTLKDSTPVIASFYPVTYTPPINAGTRFINTTLGPLKLNYWEFGDGGSSEQESPQHEFDASGSFPVFYRAEGCVNVDTITKFVNVQPPPQLQLSEDSLEFTVTCGDSVTFPITLLNSGSGQMLYDVRTICNMQDTVKTLVHYSFADSAIRAKHVLDVADIKSQPFRYEKFYGADTVAFRAALVDKQLLIFPPLTYLYDDSVYKRLAPVVNDFVERGGHVTVYYTNYNSSDIYAPLRDLDLMNAKHENNYSSIYAYSLHDTLPPLGRNLGGFGLTGALRGTLTNVLNKHKHNLVTAGEYELFSNLRKGRGSVSMISIFPSGISGASVVDFFNTIIRNSTDIGRYRWPSFLSYSQPVDTLNPGDSVILNFTIKPASLIPGSYESEIRVSYNNAPDSVSIVHLKVNISGPAKIGFDQQCSSVDNVLRNNVDSSYINIRNTGCDTLIISGAATNTSYFSVGVDTLLVPPGGYIPFKVYFQPDSVGLFYDSLILETNIGTERHCIYGRGVLPGHIAFNNSDSVLYMQACGDSASGGFWLKNDGEYLLSYSLEGGVDQIPRKVGIMTYGVDRQHEYANIVDILNQNGLNVLLDTSGYLTTSDLDYFANGKNIIILPKQEYMYYNFGQFFPFYNSVMKNGGTVAILGTDIHTAIVSSGLLVNGFSFCSLNATDTSDFTTGNCVVANDSDYFTRSMPLSFAIDSTAFPLKSLPPPIQTLVTYNGSPILAHRVNCNSGNLVYLGFDYNRYNNPQAQLLLNLVKYFNRSPFPKGVRVFPMSGSVNPGDSVYIQTSVYLDSVPEGQYPFNIIVNSSSVDVQADSTTMYVDVADNPCAVIKTNMDSSCTSTVQFIDKSLNQPVSWLWNFGDGNTSTQQNPIHTYATAGTKTVRLTVSNGSGIDTASNIINVRNLSSYTLGRLGFLNVGSLINFFFTPTIVSSVVSEVFWDFGDGIVSSTYTNSKSHIYSQPGTYYFSVRISTPYCSRTFYDTLVIVPTALEQITPLSQFNIQPNPFNSSTFINYELKDYAEVEVNVCDVAGKIVESIQPVLKQSAGKYTLKYKTEIPGLYFVQMRINGILVSHRIVKTE
jgi:Zn-dependent metalloprotease/PKD repeat protein